MFTRIVVVMLLFATPAVAQDDGRTLRKEEIAQLKRDAAKRTRAIAGKTEKTVAVDCAKGESIQKAIDGNEGSLVIEVRGICAENVKVVGRDVTLRGSDPAVDGIQGLAVDPPALAALQFWYVKEAAVENLSLSDSPSGGIGAWYSQVNLTNCRISDNEGIGVYFSALSFSTSSRLQISGNAQAGIHANRKALFACIACDVTGNRGPQATARLGALLILLRSTVSGLNGILSVGDGSYVDIDCVSNADPHDCGLNATRWAAQAHGGTAALWGAGDFTGSLLASNGETVVYGARQVSLGTNAQGNPMGNRVRYFGKMTVDPFYAQDGGAVFPAPYPLAGAVLGLNSSEFGRTIFWREAQVNGNVNCSSAGDAWRDPQTTVAPGVTITGCEHASAP